MAGPNYDSMPDDSILQTEDVDANTEQALEFTKTDPKATPADRQLNFDMAQSAIEGNRPVEDLNLDADLQDNEEAEDKYRAPSLKAYQESQAGDALNKSQAYPEDTDPSLTQAMQKSNPVADKLRNLGKMSGEERAKTGAALGAATGAQFLGKGDKGLLIGGAMGAMIARGAGMAQSGEQAKITRDNRIWNTMKTMGVAAPDGWVKFDATGVQMPAEATGRLKNLQTDVLNGNADRSLYDLDTTNPLSQRAAMVSKPIAMYLTQAMLGYRDPKNPVDAGAPKAATAMFANTFTDGVDSEDAVYSRARQMVKKMGLSEKAVKGYFSSIGKDIPIKEAEDIKKGIDILFAKEEKPSKSSKPIDDEIISMRDGDLVRSMTLGEYKKSMQQSK